MGSSSGRRSVRLYRRRLTLCYHDEMAVMVTGTSLLAPLPTSLQSPQCPPTLLCICTMPPWSSHCLLTVDIEGSRGPFFSGNFLRPSLHLYLQVISRTHRNLR